MANAPVPRRAPAEEARKTWSKNALWWMFGPLGTARADAVRSTTAEPEIPSCHGRCMLGRDHGRQTQSQLQENIRFFLLHGKGSRFLF